MVRLDESTDAVEPATQAPETAAGEPIRLPTHLSTNQWKRLPDAPAPTSNVASVETETTGSSMARRGSAIGAFKAASEPDRLRTIATQTLARGDAATAESQLAAGRQKYPQDVRIAISLARVRETRGDWKGAIEAFDSVIQLDPEEARWKTRRAECRYFNGDFSGAVADYRAAEAASAPFTVSDYSQFGDAAMRANEPAVAEAAYTSLARMAKEPLPQVELLRGVAALKQGHSDRAREILLRASAIWPQDAALTNALRVAAAAHYGPDQRPLKTAANRSLDDARQEGTIIETSGVESRIVTEHTNVPAISRWRRSALKPDASVQPAALAVQDIKTVRAASDSFEEQEGWKTAEDLPELSQEPKSSADAEPAPLADIDAPGLLP